MAFPSDDTLSECYFLESWSVLHDHQCFAFFQSMTGLIAKSIIYKCIRMIACLQTKSRRQKSKAKRGHLPSLEG